MPLHQLVWDRSRICRTNRLCCTQGYLVAGECALDVKSGLFQFGTLKLRCLDKEDDKSQLLNSANTKEWSERSGHSAGTQLQRKQIDALTTALHEGQGFNFRKARFEVSRQSGGKQQKKCVEFSHPASARQRVHPAALLCSPRDAPFSLGHCTGYTEIICLEPRIHACTRMR